MYQNIQFVCRSKCNVCSANAIALALSFSLSAIQTQTLFNIPAAKESNIYTRYTSRQGKLYIDQTLLNISVDREICMYKIIIIIYTTYIAPYIWPVWPFIGAEEGPSDII